MCWYCTFCTSACGAVFLDIFCRADLHGEHDAGDFLAHQVEQAFEQLEGFALVFLLRVLLGVAAQMDALTQVIERCQMFAPVRVEALQHDIALELVEVRTTDQINLGLIGLVGAMHDARQDVFVGQRRFRS